MNFEVLIRNGRILLPDIHMLQSIFFYDCILLWQKAVAVAVWEDI